MSKKDISKNKRLYTEKEAAEYLGVSRSYLRQDRINGRFKNRTPGPDYCRFGTMIRYDK
ncbi:MAG: helix-turn-helix domain-containing protein [Gammaproteobacteria bacterium]|nr:helix-turn-helix domain-containing protein [Gammaproteobacteria bacterium]